MKKHSLFKFISILLLIVLVVTYFVPNREGTVSYLAFGDVALNSLQSFYYFFDTALFILVVGGLYGVLNQTVAYRKLLDVIASKIKDNKKKFVFITTIIFAILVAVTGITIPLIVFVPFVMSIILLLGYDKLVAISSTIGGMLIGLIGGIFITFKNPASYYEVSFTTFDKFVGLESNFVNLFPKLLLLLSALALLIYTINKHIKAVEDKKVKYDLNEDSDILVTKVKENYKDIKVWPLIVILSVLLAVFILGLIPWESLFSVKVFSQFHTWLTGLKIGKFAVFNSIVSANFPAFGSWNTLGSYLMPIVMILLFTIIIKFVYRIKFDKLIDDFAEGTKKMLPTAVLTILASAVLICSYNNGFIETIIKSASKFNVVVASLISGLGSLTHVDLYYTVAGVFSPMVTAYTDKAILPVMALLFQSVYGLIMLVGPTSLLLIFGLSYSDVPYTTWLKYIWRFILELLLIVFAVLFIVTLI